ncbi:uncharacterized protein FOBCDRAFT_276054 [Fusarium oxysporum Fo47]|uniref:Uncharacterized protein n=1 Tax=Fusarium oxysporum Fo47 TaxID=660027 RepID=W9K8F3_FUSOX|nr:uncharacterized protein FOBCDRAFT_276054 [Fusarium oxysporum Fo47]EWZ40631.1 hypothetical protein FOZG_09283 [Fusarium oxysporum Fo47]QKD56478.2 hypothetical protein FOBCDRAFT_276054 [Fusarium oxysporum Fo47]
MEPAFKRLRQPKNWLYMLYLASNFSSTDPRDMIYGLHGLMSITRGSELLYPDYDKSTVEVYMDSVAAAFVDMQNTDVLLYAPGTDHPSWVSRWDRAMLFRNPFRFGKALPWSPSPDLKPTWSINAESKVLALRGVLGQGFGLERRMTRRVVTTLKRAMLVTAEDTVGGDLMVQAARGCY